MTSKLQIETPAETSTKPESTSDTIFTVVGIFLFMLLLWFTVRGKIRDWLMR